MRYVQVALVMVVLIAGCSSSESDTAASELADAQERIAELEEQVADLEEQVADSERPGESLDRQSIDLIRDCGDRAVVIVFLEDDISNNATALQQMEDDLANHDGVAEHSFVTKEEALAEARVLLADEPDTLATIENNPSILPASLRFELASLENAVALRASAAELDGVIRATLAPQCGTEQ